VFQPLLDTLGEAYNGVTDFLAHPIQKGIIEPLRRLIKAAGGAWAEGVEEVTGEQAAKDEAWDQAVAENQRQIEALVEEESAKNEEAIKAEWERQRLQAIEDAKKKAEEEAKAAEEAKKKAEEEAKKKAEEEAKKKAEEEAKKKAQIEAGKKMAAAKAAAAKAAAAKAGSPNWVDGSSSKDKDAGKVGSKKTLVTGSTGYTHSGTHYSGRDGDER
jgi:membrane protein involved in colicin uptake